MPWIDTCSADDIGLEDAMPFDHDGRTFALFRNHEGDIFCTDGLCTHEDVHLADGIVEGNTIECPRHASVFDFTTGEVDSPPAFENLRTYPAEVRDGRVFVEI